MSVVSVQQPDSNRYKDPLEQVAKALNIAQSIFGIKTAYEQSKLNNLQLQHAEQQIKVGDVDLASKEHTHFLEVNGIMDPKDVQKEYITDSSPDGAALMKYKTYLGKDGEFLPIMKIKEFDKDSGGYKEIFGLDKTMLSNIQKSITDRANESYKNTLLAATTSRQNTNDARDVAYKIKNDVDSFQLHVANDIDSLKAAENVRSLIKGNNPIADSVALRQLFRISGDVGAIRPEDLKQLGTDPSAVGILVQSIGQITEGQRITPEARVSIDKAVDLLRRNVVNKINNVAKARADNMAAAYGRDPSEMLDRLGVKSLLGEQMQSVADQPVKSSSLPGENTAIGAEPFDANAYLNKNKPANVRPPLLPGR